MSNRTKQELQELQGLPLRLKIMLTEQRIRDWVNEYGEDGVYVSFSGGKDSTVLLHIARKLFPNMKAVFSNTSLEFPEIVKFVETFSNVDVVRPKMPYVEVIKKYGYPMISKEVSECVHGARKYLTAVIEENSLNQSIKSGIGRNIVNYADLVSTKSITGGLRKQVPKTQRNRSICYQFEWNKLTGNGKYGKQCRNVRKQASGGRRSLEI